MKKALISGMIVLVLAAPMLAGVVKKTKADVTFRGFGKFSLAQSEKLTAELRWADMKSDFKGQGIAGGLAAKTILRSGDTGEIIDLTQSTVSKLDNKKKEYTVGPIEKIEQEKTEGKRRTSRKPRATSKSPRASSRSRTRAKNRRSIILPFESTLSTG
jgi:hypothetical protein